MKSSTTRLLLAIHRWCGVIVSANLLVLAVTGVILIFHDEIDHALGSAVPTAAAGENRTSLAQAVELARAATPGAQPVYVFADPEEFPGVLFVGMARGKRTFEASQPVSVDLRQGKLLPKLNFDDSFTGIVFHLHAELLAGPIGRLLVGVIALALLASLVTGAVVYGPMMQRFAFGLVRRGLSRRTFWADLHKLLGAATFGWTLLVTLTGLLLSLGSIAIQIYASTELKQLGAAYASQPVVEALGTLDAAVARAEESAPGRRFQTVALPGSDLASPRHYTVLLKGGTGLESRMLTLALVDATDPTRVNLRELPLYLKALLLSEPLHFGDYGGVTLKLVWAGFGIAMAGLSVSGLWVFWTARRRARVEPRPFEQAPVGS
jgi:uncharacterized iron-regulated membrane protein